MVELRPTTQADVDALYGGMLPISVVGITGHRGNRVLGMGALYASDGCMVMICRIAPEARGELRQHTRALLTAARRLLTNAVQHGLPVRVVADRTQPRAVALIEHLGFRHITKDVYEWTIPA